MKKTGIRVGTVLRRIAQVFGLFLGVLTALSMAHYPIHVEALASIYRAERDQANNLVALLTVVGFAVAIVAAAMLSRRQHLRIGKRRLGVATTLGCSGVLFLTICMVGLIANTTVARKSAYLATAALLADQRKDFDVAARNAAQKIHDESLSVEERYRSAREFMESKELAQVPVAQVLSGFHWAPLQGPIFMTYVTTILMLRLGLFTLASGLYAWSMQRR
jgi:hypothetical protein